jgi:chromosome condensin MukBEF MukE localization factor
VTLYNRYLLTLAVLFTLSTTILAAYGQDKLDAYFTVYVIEYLVATLLFVYLEPRARKLLDAMGYVLFGGFMVIVALKVIEILRRS